MRDGVADLLLRIKNALARTKETVDMPSSYVKEEISKILFEEGFTQKHEVLTRGGKKILRITLKYGADKFGKPNKPAIRDIRQVSKPGKRIYVGIAKIPKVQSGFGIAILSTPKGILSDSRARHEKTGGEVMAYVF